MGFWQTGYMEFHDPTWPTHAGPQPEYEWAPPPPRVYPCAVCGKEFDSQEVLSSHRFEAHPRRYPVLYLLGRQASSPPIRNVISAPLSASDIELEDAAFVTVDGLIVPAGELCHALAGPQHGLKIVVLSTGAIEKRYELKFEIAVPAELAEVDHAFFHLTATGDVSVRRIQDFVALTRQYNTASRYVEGLAQYLYGKLAKERSGGTHIPFEDYRQRFNQALDAMNGFGTSLARTIVGLVNFSANVFDGYAHLRHTPHLYGGMRFFHQVLRGRSPNALSVPRRGSSAGGRIPADLASEAIIGWAFELMSGGRLEEENLVRKYRGDSNWPPDDQFKLVVLLAEHCRRVGRTEEARELARPYVEHPLFRSWANTYFAVNSSELPRE